MKRLRKTNGTKSVNERKYGIASVVPQPLSGVPETFTVDRELLQNPAVPDTRIRPFPFAVREATER